MAADFVVLIISWFFLLMIIKMFFAPDNDPMGKISEIEVFVFAVALITYFKGFDPFPASLPGPFAALHVITIGAINAMAMLDLFFETVLGVSLSLDLIFGIFIPAFITYGISRNLLKYTATLSDNTVTFISYIIAFITIWVAAKGGTNLIMSAVGLIQSFFELAGLSSILSFTSTVFFFGVVLCSISIYLDFLAGVTTQAMAGDIE